MNYRVSSSSPTDELLTIGRIFSEVGGYASTILDREHLSMSRKCMTRLDKVVGELVSRQSIQSAANLYDLPQGVSVGVDLTSMTVSELHDLYRSRPLRSRERGEKGREQFTFYYEGKIVRELSRRKAADKAERLKIDYCNATYRNELYNMSLVLSRPEHIEGEKIVPDSGKDYTPDELAMLIRLYSGYRDIEERELLVEYVDIALDLLEKNQHNPAVVSLLTELAELKRSGLIRIPDIVNQQLEKEVESRKPAGEYGDCERVMALLTLQIIKRDPSLEEKAERIINRCYRCALSEGRKCEYSRENEVSRVKATEDIAGLVDITGLENIADLEKRIDCLYTAVECSEYVDGYDVRKVAAVWNELSAKVIASDSAKVIASDSANPMAKAIFRLLEIARECEGHTGLSGESEVYADLSGESEIYADLSGELKERLAGILETASRTDSLARILHLLHKKEKR